MLGFEITLPSKWIAHCHCTMCRRAAGAAFVTWVGVADWNFRIMRGADHLVWYRSSVDARRGFCNQCGSSVFFKSQRWPGETHVAYANFTQPLDKAPQAHAYWETHVDWVKLADVLPRKTSTDSPKKAPA
jgi:hypothetical protein